MMKYRFIIVLPCLLWLAGCAKYWKVTELKEPLHFNNYTHQYHDNQQAGHENAGQHQQALQTQHVNTVPHPQHTQATAEAHHSEDKEHALMQGASEDGEQEDN